MNIGRALSSLHATASSTQPPRQPALRQQPRTGTRVAVSSFESPSPPPPPPPPPPPLPPQRTRRDALMTYLGAFGAGTIGSVAGYLIGSRGPGDAPGVAPISPQERREIDSLRAEAQFRREYDGHVWVRARAGDWWEARLDAQIPGTVLMRNPEGYVYFLNLNIQQIDLTDDYVMAAVFGDGSWEANVQRVQARDDASGEPMDLQMPTEAFRDLISLMT